MGERMTWEEIQEKYPDQWVGLVDVEWVWLRCVYETDE